MLATITALPDGRSDRGKRTMTSTHPATGTHGGEGGRGRKTANNTHPHPATGTDSTSGGEGGTRARHIDPARAAVAEVAAFLAALSTAEGARLDAYMTAAGVLAVAYRQIDRTLADAA